MKDYVFEDESFSDGGGLDLIESDFFEQVEDSDGEDDDFGLGDEGEAWSAELDFDR